MQATEPYLVSEILEAEGDKNVWGLMRRLKDKLELRHGIFIIPDPKSFWMKTLDEYPAVVVLGRLICYNPLLNSGLREAC